MTASSDDAYRQALAEALPLYALGDVDANDAIAIERALAADPENRALLRSLTETVHQLALLAPTAAPPPNVLDRIWGRLDPPGEPTGSHAIGSAIARAAPRGARGAPTRSWMSRGMPLALAAASALVLVLFALLAREIRTRALLQDAVDGTLAQLARDSEERGALAQQLDALRSPLDERQRSEVIRMLQAPDLHVALLGPREAAATGIVRVVWRRSDASWLVVGSGLGPLPPDRDLQLWGLRAGTPVPAAVLQLGPDGTVHMRVPLAGALAGSDTAAVTLEPKGGMTQPTGPTLFAGTI